jgi:hypothetical protein
LSKITSTASVFCGGVLWFLRGPAEIFQNFSFQTLGVVMEPGTDIRAAFLSRYGLNFSLLPWLVAVQARQ